MSRARRRTSLLLVAVAAIVAGCAPTVVVENATTISVRVGIDSGFVHQMLSPSPGESSAVEVEEGNYRAVVIPDTEWIEYAKLTRTVLTEQVLTADPNRLSHEQLQDVIQRLKDITAQIEAFEAAASSRAACSGSVSESGGGGVIVSMAEDGTLAITCD